jgi:16S rRNA (cytosine1402-N4)-methyltransferase
MTKTMNDYHIPVMLKECLEGMNITPDGKYVDVTFGGGGHSMAILEKLTTGKLVAFDQDDEAQNNLVNHDNLIFVNHNFQYLKNFLKFHEVIPVNAILADLGVSSHQIDTEDRGFSFRFDSELDMRMNRTQELSAKQLINSYSAEQLTKIFRSYGELKPARPMAATIVQAREIADINNTHQLLDVLRKFTPKHKRNKFLAQVFQALRIAVNGELNALEALLNQSTEVLDTGGRLVVMSYHSLEDRLVKNFIQTGNIEGIQEKDFYGNPIKPFKNLTRKPITASEAELEINPRSRSAKLRIAEKL